MTKKTAETENFEGKHVPLSANIQRFFELIVQRVISTLQFWNFRAFSPLAEMLPPAEPAGARLDSATPWRGRGMACNALSTGLRGYAFRPVARKRAPLPGCYDIGRSFPRGYNGGQVGRGSGHPCRGASLDDETIGPCAAQVHFPPQTLSLDRMAMVWAPARGASLSTLHGKESGFSTAQYTRWRRVQRRRPLQNGLSPKKRCVFGRDFAEYPRCKELRVRAKGVCLRT